MTPVVMMPVEAALLRLRDVLIDQCLASFATPPRRLTLDIDTLRSDPRHQQLTFFRRCYDQYQHQPWAITCAENDRELMVGLHCGWVHALWAPMTTWNTW